MQKADAFSGFLIGIVAGVILGAIFEISFFSSVFWVVFAILVVFLALFRPNIGFLVLAFIAGGVLGLFRVSGDLYGREVFQGLVGKTVELSGEVKSDPDFEGSDGKIRLDSLTIDGHDIRGVIYLSGKLNNNIQREDRLTIRGKMSEGFGVYAGSMYKPEILEITKPTQRGFLLRFRDGFAESARENIKSSAKTKRELVGPDSEEESAEGESAEYEEPDWQKLVDQTGEREVSLGLAYLTGLRTGLDEDLNEVLRLVGLTHLVVASGTHLGILVGFFKKFFGKISRFSGFYFGLIFILLFGEMVGWTASITRAAIVAILGILGWFLGRKFDSWRVILFAMAITLLVNPMFVADLGWQLSFGSFFGIMILSPRLVRFFYGEKVGGKFLGKKKPGAISEIIFATISATLVCGPILVYYFGSLSLISIFANLMILPTIPLAMGLMFLTGVSGMVPFLSSAGLVLGKITKLLLDYHLVVMKFFSKQRAFIMGFPKGDLRVFLLYLPILMPFLVGEIVRTRKIREQSRRIRENPEKYLRLTRKTEKNEDKKAKA
ncbi:ComEC/Rec2 family competence protein [Candidatus Saccharibacteria bacterium]|nr:ComEC/Rec2 family competence protein [Candidatus Saccharibacteria bacterium]